MPKWEKSVGYHAKKSHLRKKWKPPWVKRVILKKKIPLHRFSPEFIFMWFSMWFWVLYLKEKVVEWRNLRVSLKSFFFMKLLQITFCRHQWSASHSVVWIFHRENLCFYFVFLDRKILIPKSVFKKVFFV